MTENLRLVTMFDWDTGESVSAPFAPIANAAKNASRIFISTTAGRPQWLSIGVSLSFGDYPFTTNYRSFPEEIARRLCSEGIITFSLQSLIAKGLAQLRAV